MFTFAVLALVLLATSVNSQKTVTAWKGGCSSNCTFSNPAQWTNGAPDANSIVVINETTCNACDIDIIEDLVIAELHVTSGATATGPYLYIYGKLTVTDKFVVGNQATSSYCSYITFSSPNAELILNSDSTIHYCSSNIFRTYDSTSYGTITNNGTITVMPTDGQTYFYYQSFSDSRISINNWGKWVATNPLAGFDFQDLMVFNHYAGSYNGTYQAGSSSSYVDATIRWYDVDFYIHSSDIAFDGPVRFRSFYSNSYSYVTTSYVARVYVNATGTTLSNVEFDGSNVIFLYDTTLDNCNITGSTTLNGTDVKITLTGSTLGSSFILNAESGRLTFEIAENAVFSPTGDISLWGEVYFINYGTIQDASAYFYVDINSYVINAGLVELSSSYIYFRESYLKTGSGTGTVVNKGTIELIKSSYVSWSGYDGEFRQCDSSWIKLGINYPDAGDSFGYVSFSTPYLDGYIAPYFGKDYQLTSYTLFTYDQSKFADSDNTFQGDVSFTPTWDSIADFDFQDVCISTSSGAVYGYGSDYSSCKTLGFESSIPSIKDGSSACSNLPDDIQSLVSTCPISAQCGSLPNNVPLGEGSASGLQISIALLISALALLFKF